MPETVIKTRITPKRLTESIISREKLRKRFTEGSSKNIILVTGPAGYGKTTSVLDFLCKQSKPYSWLSISPDIDNFYRFITYLVHSIKFLNDKFGGKTLELAESFSQSGLFTKDSSSSIRSVMGSFVNEFLEQFNDDLYLVLDDLHNIEENTWLNTAFDTLTENFPQNLHIIITSRSVPGFNLARITSKRNLLKITSSDLEFTAKETEALLTEIYSIPFTKKDISVLDEKIEGWITGLHLILQAYGDDFKKISENKLRLDESIFNFFAEDIFNRLDKNTRIFLVSSSLLDHFTPEICDIILGINNSSEILNELRNKNLFIESALDETSNGETVHLYNYHNLFREFLSGKLKEELSQEEVLVLTEKISKYYKSTGNLIKAVEFDLISQNYEKAAFALAEIYESLFDEGRYELLWKWINQFPGDLFEHDRNLNYFKGKLLRFYKNDIQNAKLSFQAVIRDSESTDELNVLANMGISEILQLTGEPEKALEMMKNIFKSDKSPELQSKVIISLAKAYFRLGSEYFDEIIRLLDECHGLIEENIHVDIITDVYKFYGQVYSNKGEFLKSLHYFQRALSFEKDIFKKFNIIYEIVRLYALSGQYEKAKQFYDQALNIFNSFHVPIFERGFNRLTALLKFETGDLEDSIDLLGKLVVEDTKTNFRSFILTYYILISESYLLLGNKTQSEEYMTLAGKIVNPGDEYLAREFDYNKALIDKMDNVRASVEKTLLSALKHYESQNFVYNITQVHFHLADLYYRKGNYQTSLKFLSNCLKTASEKQYISFLIQHYSGMRYLFDFALSSGIEKDFLFSIYQIIKERNSFDWLSEKCKKRLNKESKELCDIHLTTLGGIEILARGKQVKEDKWIRKKSKLLLIYLLVNQGIKIQKDKVMGLFFGELSPESADNVFHQSITNIRNCLKADQIQKSDEKTGKKKIRTKDSDPAPAVSYLVYEDKILSMATGFDYFVDVIEFSRLASIVKSSESPDNIKETAAKDAITLYKGEFLPGYYEDWIEEQRNILEHKYIELCEELLRILKKEGKFEELAVFSEKLILSDNLHENAFLNAIEAYQRSGNRNMAKKKFSQLLKNYEEEYGEKPNKDILEKISFIMQHD
jgi:ATP/maltotriose-dependent transcriptional regulator MalT/two-component SAPR family response regulator